MSNQEIVTAAMVAIGDELLSGRTKDKNIGHLADVLSLAAIDLKEVRIVSDDHEAIIEAVNALRTKFDYVFTSGGIGPTHDDITADAISAAFGLPCIKDDRAMELLSAMYERRGLEFSEARQRMARMPQGAKHIENAVSVAPGFQVENVYVMAGVPAVFQAMLNSLLPTLRSGTGLMARTVVSPYGEGDIGSALAQVQADHGETSIGSYPKFDGKFFSTDIVVRARKEEVLDAAVAAVEAMLQTVGARKASDNSGNEP